MILLTTISLLRPRNRQFPYSNCLSIGRGEGKQYRYLIREKKMYKNKKKDDQSYCITMHNAVQKEPTEAQFVRLRFQCSGVGINNIADCSVECTRDYRGRSVTARGLRFQFGSEKFSSVVQTSLLTSFRHHCV